MTREEAIALVAEINAAFGHAARQVSIEFEGEHPGMTLSGERRGYDLEAKLNDGGFALLKGQLYSADEIQKIREAFNGRVTAWMANNKGKQVSSAQLKAWENEVGMSQPNLRMMVETLGLNKK